MVQLNSGENPTRIQRWGERERERESQSEKVAIDMGDKSCLLGPEEAGSDLESQGWFMVVQVVHP